MLPVYLSESPETIDACGACGACGICVSCAFCSLCAPCGPSPVLYALAGIISVYSNALLLVMAIHVKPSE